jgi:predicted 3-demethylubiquinone-9 3-methyltransferase (glyoxalase superfamily)
MQKIVPCLWFDTQAEEAMRFYTTVFPDAAILEVKTYQDSGLEMKDVLFLAVIRIAGQELMLFNGGPHFKLNEAISLVVRCADQAEVDDYWAKLTDGGEESMCGWLKDRFGLSWQIVPDGLDELLTDPDREKSMRATQAMLQMRKLDIHTLRAAAAG